MNSREAFEEWLTSSNFGLPVSDWEEDNMYAAWKAALRYNLVLEQQVREALEE